MLGGLVREPALDREGRARVHVVDVRADAFRDLLDRHLDGAYRLASVILNDRVEAEDAVHDATVSAWAAFDRLRHPDRFEAWFRRILVNGCRDRLRGRTRHRVVDLGRELAESEHPLEGDASERTATRDALERASRAWARTTRSWWPCGSAPTSPSRRSPRPWASPRAR
jgi:RNA polymerase sigma-70 factor (ECF subfamily)